MGRQHWSLVGMAVAAGQVPNELAKMRVLELGLMNVVAGTRFRGDFEERIVLSMILKQTGT